MQTLLPYPDYHDSAECLDNNRLNRQRLEAKQILTTLVRGEGGLVHHPAVQMWSGHELSLARYGAVMCEEWTSRGYKDTLWKWFVEIAACLSLETMEVPSWLGDDAFHASHRSNLLRKDPAHYGQFGWTEPPDLPYVWPVTDGKEAKEVPAVQ